MDRKKKAKGAIRGAEKDESARERHMLEQVRERTGKREWRDCKKPI